MWKKPVIPIYKPYKNYHPLIVGFLVDKELHSRDISAGILSLIQKKYIQVKRTEDGDYLFRSIVNIYKVDDELDSLLLQMIFVDNKINLDIFVGKIEDDEIHNTKNDFRTFEITLSKLKHKIDKVEIQQKRIEEFVRDFLIDNDYFKISKNTISFGLLILIFAASIISWLADWKFFFFLFLILLAVITYFSKNSRLEYQEKGLKAKNNLIGFKLFLEMTEKERMEYFNAPEKNPQEFFEYLPYAVALGVEEKWKEEFDSITDIEFIDSDLNNLVSLMFFVVIGLGLKK